MLCDAAVTSENDQLRNVAIERAFRLVDRALFVPTVRPQTGSNAASSDDEEEDDGDAAAAGGGGLDDDTESAAAPLPAPRSSASTFRVPRATRAQIDAVKQQSYIGQSS